MDLSSSKKILAVALASSALLAGCHDDDDAPVTPVDPVAVSGTAVKGVLSSADVVACIFGSDCASAADFTAASGATGFLGSALTAADGTYSIDVGAEGQGEPVVVRLFANADTMEVCDYDGCGDIGQTVDVDDSLSLETVTFVSAGSETISAPVTVLTTVAAQTLEAQLTESGVTDAAFADATPASISAALESASENTLTALGVDSTLNIFETTLVSATSDELQGEDDAVAVLSVVNAAIGGLSDADTTLSEAIEDVATQVSTFVVDAQDGAATTDTETALETTLAALAAEVDSVETSSETTVEVVVTTDVDAGEVVDTPVIVEDPTGASSGGDSTGA